MNITSNECIDFHAVLTRNWRIRSYEFQQLKYACKTNIELSTNTEFDVGNGRCLVLSRAAEVQEIQVYFLSRKSVTQMLPMIVELCSTPAIVLEPELPRALDIVCETKPFSPEGIACNFEPIVIRSIGWLKDEEIAFLSTNFDLCMNRFEIVFTTLPRTWHEFQTFQNGRVFFERQTRDDDFLTASQNVETKSRARSHLENLDRLGNELGPTPGTVIPCSLSLDEQFTSPKCALVFSRQISNNVFNGNLYILSESKPSEKSLLGARLRLPLVSVSEIDFQRNAVNAQMIAEVVHVN